MKTVPFMYGKSSDFINFTDREEECNHLETNFKSLINTILISPRRWGKTSLVDHVVTKISKENKNIKICQLDLFNVRTEQEFYSYYATTVLKSTSTHWEEMVENAKKFLSHLLPKITLSPDSFSEFSFGVSWEEIEKNPDEILNLPELIANHKKIKVVVCIDEFQSINDFPSSLNIQRKLRSQWQHHHNVAYCLFGSKRSMLLDIFSNTAMPFYKFGDIIFLQKIPTVEWGKFIQRRFEETHKKISIEQAEYIAKLVENHSYYVQQLAQQSWLRTKTSCNNTIIETALESIKNQLSLLFVGQIETLTTTQINFLKATLDGVTAYSAQEILKNYRLGTSSNLKNIRNALISREIIDISEQNVEILDPFFKLWLEENYFNS